MYYVDPKDVSRLVCFKNETKVRIQPLLTEKKSVVPLELRGIFPPERARGLIKLDR